MFRRSESVETLLGPGTRFSGNMSSKGTLKVYGSVEGDIVADLLITAEGSSVSGTVSAGGVIVGGSVEGNITARERVEVKHRGSVRGDISTKRLSVEDGARLWGRLSMSEQKEKA